MVRAMNSSAGNRSASQARDEILQQRAEKLAADERPRLLKLARAIHKSSSVKNEELNEQDLALQLEQIQLSIQRSENTPNKNSHANSTGDAAQFTNLLKGSPSDDLSPRSRFMARRSRSKDRDLGHLLEKHGVPNLEFPQTKSLFVEEERLSPISQHGASVLEPDASILEKL